MSSATAAAARKLIARWAPLARDREAARSEVARSAWVARTWVRRAGELTGHGDALFFMELPEKTPPCSCTAATGSGSTAATAQSRSCSGHDGSSAKLINSGGNSRHRGRPPRRARRRRPAENLRPLHRLPRTAPWPRFSSAMRPWTPQHDGLQRYKVTHATVGFARTAIGTASGLRDPGLCRDGAGRSSSLEVLAPEWTRRPWRAW